MHTRNDFEATANLLYAGRSHLTPHPGYWGATGNPLRRSHGLEAFLKIDMGIDTRRFREIAEYVARASAREIPAWKPIVGLNCFSHEAGIHADGVMKFLSNYEPYSPEEVGMSRKIIIGKHSGRSTIKQVLNDRGINIDDDTATAILEVVRATSVSLKRSLSENELVYIYQDYMEGGQGRPS